MATSTTTVTPKNQHIFVALAELMDQSNLSEKEIATYLHTEEQYVKVSKLAKKRKKALDARLARIVNVTLGIKDMKEFRLMSPQQVEKLFKKRYKDGDFTMETPIQFRKKSHRSRPAYMEVLKGLVGEAGIIEVQAAAPVGYSYTIDEVSD